MKKCKFYRVRLSAPNDIIVLCTKNQSSFKSLFSGEVIWSNIKNWPIGHTSDSWRAERDIFEEYNGEIAFDYVKKQREEKLKRILK